MPEYLSPGVFIEEIPARLKAIEGVSTSTAGFVGPAERGPVAGFPIPFTPTNGLKVTADQSPLLVTSFNEFTRIFGRPLPLPTATDSNDNGYLAQSVKSFFDNGGKRAYVARVVHQGREDDNNSATPSTIRLHQGVITRLAQPVRTGESTLNVTSLRGIKIDDALLIKLRSTGQLVFGATPATLTGTKKGPFVLAENDQFSVKIGGTEMKSAVVKQATEASIETKVGPFDLTDGMDLQIRVGPTSEPIQTITFATADFADISNATSMELSKVLRKFLKGVRVSVPATDNAKLQITTVKTGVQATITVDAGSAIAKLGLTNTSGNIVAGGSTSGLGNVRDRSAVSISEIVSLFSPTPVIFKITDDGTGRIKFASIEGDSGITLELANVAGDALTKFGISTTPAKGADAPVFRVASIDTQRKQIQLSAELKSDIDPGDVFLTRDGETLQQNKGPKFFARSPGAWSEKLSVMITPSERNPTAITTAALSTSQTIQVQTAGTFYRGAIVEIDHGINNSFERTQNEIVDVQGPVLTLEKELGHAVDEQSLIRVLEISVTIADGSGVGPLETFEGLSWNPKAELRRHYATQINAGSRLAYVQPPGNGTPTSLDGSEDGTLSTQPTTSDGFPLRPTTAKVGRDGLPLADELGDEDYIGIDGGPGKRSGIQSLSDVDDIRIVAAPGKTTARVQAELMKHCEIMRYRFAILDGKRSTTEGVVSDLLAHRSLYDSSFAAYYSPWIGEQRGNEVIYLPPSGYVAGIYARTDNERGVHKAPANEVVRNSTGLQSYFTTGEQDILNPRGVNAIRRFDGRGIRVWGARTLSSDPEFRYVNVRRFMIFLEASIDRGTQYVVFEPNAPETWSRVVDSISAFLNTQWRNGALFGRRADDAYYVRCDESTMTVDDIQNGRLICDIGVAIVRPAEFVIFRIEQITGFANKS